MVFIHRHSLGYYINEVNELANQLSRDHSDGRVASIFLQDSFKSVMGELQRAVKEVIAHIKTEENVLIGFREKFRQFAAKKAGEGASEAVDVQIQNNFKDLEQTYQDLRGVITLDIEKETYHTAGMRYSDTRVSGSSVDSTRRIEALLGKIRTISQELAMHIFKNQDLYRNELVKVKRERIAIRKFQRNFRSWLGEIEDLS